METATCLGEVEPCQRRLPTLIRGSNGSCTFICSDVSFVVKCAHICAEQNGFVLFLLAKGTYCLNWQFVVFAGFHALCLIVSFFQPVTSPILVTRWILEVLSVECRVLYVFSMLIETYGHVTSSMLVCFHPRHFLHLALANYTDVLMVNILCLII